MHPPCPRLLAALLLACAAPIGLAPAQEIAFTRYELPNGLTVILHEDHALPLVALNIWYYVGSKDEPPRRSGFAHLFEHLMFMGTDRFPYPEFDTRMEKGGASNNATTSTDRTNYFESGPRELLETFLELEADRMGFLGKSMTQEKLDSQREVVRNERRQRYEIQPYGKVHLDVPKRIYPSGHPYHEPVIGSHEDLEAATVEDVKSFFGDFYFPRNASLVLAGDFDPEEAKKLIAKHFGPLPSKPALKRAVPEPPAIQGPLRATITDAVSLPLVAFVWHSPAYFRPGDAEMDTLATALGAGKSSRLYRRLVFEKKLAQEVTVAQRSHFLSSELWIQILARPGAALDEIESEVDAEIARLKSEGLTAREVTWARNRFEMGHFQGVQGLDDRADLLNRYQFHFGDPGSIEKDLGRYAEVTPEGARDWARKVLDDKARLILRVLPESVSNNPGVGPRPSEDKPGKERRRGVSTERYGEEARRHQAQPRPAEASQDYCSRSEEKGKGAATEAPGPAKKGS
jgi:zinc protease